MALTRLFTKLRQKKVSRLGEVGGPRPDDVDAELNNTVQFINDLIGDSGGSLPNDLYLSNVPKSILRSSAKTGNVGTGLNTLRSYSLPAGSMASNDDLLHFWLGGLFGINDDNKRIQLSFGGNLLFNFGSNDHDDFGWFTEGIIVRLSNTTFNFITNNVHGQIVSDSTPTTSSPGGVVTARGGDVFTLSGGTTFSGNNQTLLLEAESATATNDNIIHNIAKIELTRL